MSRQIGGELVLVPLLGRGTDADAIFHLNRTAAFVWEQLDGGLEVAEIARLMSERFEVDAERAQAECGELLETLRSIGAVTWVDERT